MQKGRLFKIVYCLLDRGSVTASELAKKFEVSVRTIYRDIDTLSEAGIPIYTETGRNGGICLMKDFVLDKALLSEEKHEILAGLRSLNTAADINCNNTLDKLAATFNVNSESWLEVDFSRWGNKEDDNKKFASLKSAIIHHKAVKIIYASSYEIISQRKIYPLKLSYKSKSWYVKAYCTEKNGYRIFKLTRILDLEVLNEKFFDYIYPKQSANDEQEYKQITLCFTKEMAYRVYDEFDKTEVSIQENGDLLVSAKIPEDMWIVGYLLSFGTQVEIIEPTYLKSIIAEYAKQIYEKNKT